MIERLLILLVLLAAGYAAYQFYMRYQLGLAARQAAADPLLAGLLKDVPAIVYFTTPDCAPCRLQQTPILNGLQAELGANLQLIRVDAAADPAAAQRWGVMTVPTLFVLGEDGQPRHVHNGVVDAATLKRELIFDAQRA
ncbi:thioredoxin family protein [bacterium]|nr:thioredoxin family protein [bacterium]